MSSGEILVYTSVNTTRFRYAAHVLFKCVLKQEYRVVTNKMEYENSDSPKVSYSYQKIGDEGVNIVPSGLLEQTGLEEFSVQVSWEDEVPKFFKTNSALGFDIFSAVFFLASRYEEYWPHKKDKHGRFSSSGSLAVKHNFLHLPVINMWAAELLKLLTNSFGLEDKREYEALMTVDVDNAYAYLEKGVVRTTGALLRSLFTTNFDDLIKRSKALVGLIPDPFDTFDRILFESKETGIKTLFFFLVGDYGLNDKNVPIHSRKFQGLIKHIFDYAMVGLHPSYASNTEAERIGLERERLTQVVHHPIYKSRQHFLIVDMPYTYRNLMQYDITEDFSMGYADEPGFRASIASPFPFYDLEMEKQTRLTIYPFSFMEATYKYYRPEDKPNMLADLKSQTDLLKELKAQQVILWHSDSLSEVNEWKGWSPFFRQSLDILAAS